MYFTAHDDAFPLQQREKDDHGNGGNFDFERAIHDGKHVRHVFADDDADGAGAAAGGEPVAPADDEAGEIADGATREIVLAAAFGYGGAEFGELKGADEGIDRAAEPDTEEKPMIGKARGDVTGSADNAGGNGIADGNGNAETYAENLQEFALFLARMRGAHGKVGG